MTQFTWNRGLGYPGPYNDADFSAPASPAPSHFTWSRGLGWPGPYNDSDFATEPGTPGGDVTAYASTFTAVVVGTIAEIDGFDVVVEGYGPVGGVLTEEVTGIGAEEMAIDRIVFSPSTPRNVNEGSTARYTVKFYSEGVAASPSTMRYRVDDEASGDEVLEWRTATAATSVAVTLTPNTNQMLEEGNRRERRRLTVEVDADTDNAFSESVFFDVVNQYGL